MTPTSRRRHSQSGSSTAEALLGADHPLTRALERQRVTIEHAVVVGALQSASAIALLAGMADAVSLVVGAAVVAVALASRAAMLATTGRFEVLDLISKGGGELPIPTVVQTRARLLDRNHRRQLTASLRTLRVASQEPSQAYPPTRVLLNARVATAVASELNEIAELLQTDHASLRGIALMERLLTDATSPLFGKDAEPATTAPRPVSAARLIMGHQRPCRDRPVARPTRLRGGERRMMHGRPRDRKSVV